MDALVILGFLALLSGIIGIVVMLRGKRPTKRPTNDQS